METPMASDEEFPPLQGPVSSPCGKGEIPIRDSPSSSSPGDPTDQGHGIRSWASLLFGGPLVGSQPEHPLEVEIQDGKFKVFIPKEAYDEMNRPFQWAALARLQGSSPNGRTNFSFVFQELTRQWAGKAHPKFTILAGGTFLIQVEDEQQLHCITQKQAWRVGGRTLVTCRWQPGQSLNMPPATSALLWICLPNLPPNMWIAQIFNSIVKGLQGELLEIDTQTRDINRGDESQEEEPTRSPSTTNDAKPLEDKTNEVRVNTTRRAKNKAIIRDMTENQTNMANPFYRSGSLPTEIPPEFSFKTLSQHKSLPLTKAPCDVQPELHTADPQASNFKILFSTGGITHSRGRGNRLSGHRKFAQDTSNRSFANPDPAGPAGKHKRISLGRVDALADTSPPSQTSDFPTAVGEGSVSDQNIDSSFIFDTLINADRLHINSSFLGSYATMTNADMCDGVVRILCGWKPQRYSVAALNLHRYWILLDVTDKQSHVNFIVGGDRHSYNEVMHALDALKLSSGLCVNPHKSHVISLGEQSAPLSFINSDWQQGSLPLPYLGTPLFAGNM
ncbi:hypothetical protein EJ110_NYTH34154 [Nymphaea thermarum]|nr:hypothetical protein EJ110_NYTH34154 [Nymphaea thermarum]